MNECAGTLLKIICNAINHVIWRTSGEKYISLEINLNYRWAYFSISQHAVDHLFYSFIFRRFEHKYVYNFFYHKKALVVTVVEKSSAGDIQLKSNNDTLWLEHKTKCPTAFSKQIKLSSCNQQKKNAALCQTQMHIAHANTHTLTDTQLQWEKERQCVRLFAHCLHRSCADYISYRIWMRHMSALFHSRNGIIVICILMNILQYVLFHLAGSGRQSGDLYTSDPIQYCFPVRVCVCVCAHIFHYTYSRLHLYLQSIFNLNFRFVKMDFYTGHRL